MSSAQQAFFFGTGTSATSFGQPLGLSIIRVGLTDGNQDPGDCTSVSTSCAGVYVGDMQAAIANGARVFSSPWFHRQPTRPTAAQFARLLEGVAHFQAEATGITLPGSRTSFKASRLKCRLPSRFKLSIQNEPDQCPSYDGALWSAANIDTFIKSNLAPTFSSAGISTPIFEPEGGNYPSTQSLGATCRRLRLLQQRRRKSVARLSGEFLALHRIASPAAFRLDLWKEVVDDRGFLRSRIRREFLPWWIQYEHVERPKLGCADRPEDAGRRECVAVLAVR